MNDFKESLRVERDKFGKITVTESLKNLLIELMKGNITKPELMARTGIGDKGTVELKIKEIVAENPELRPLYEEYLAGKRENFMGYQFRAEAIEMLRREFYERRTLPSQRRSTATSSRDTLKARSRPAPSF